MTDERARGRRGGGAAWLLAASLAAAFVLGGCESVRDAVPELLPVGVERNIADPMGAAIGIGAGGCVTAFEVLIVAPDLAALDRQIDARGGNTGRYLIGDATIFFGSDEAAARDFGATALFVGTRGEAWIRTEAGKARQMVEFRTPAGRSVWLLTGGASTGACR